MNIRVGMHDHRVVTLDDSIDYSDLLEMVLTALSEPVQLLETVTHQWSKNVKLRYPEILYSKISIKKLNPPLRARVDHAEVTVEKYYEE